jgi:hypothetical protein
MPRYDDDDDDDRPRRRRPRDDDDRSPWRDRPRDRPPARSSNAAVIAVVAIAVGVVVAGVVGGLYLFHRVQKKNDQFVARVEADIAREEARRKTELAKAAADVRAAGAGGAVQVTAAQLAKAYEDDEDRADRLYKNKVLEVTGTLDEVDFTGETYTVLLKAGPDDTVNCEFAKDPDTRARLVRLKPGDTVRIRGKCLGEFATLEACVLVE